MTSRPRIDFEGAWHHVLNRGASKKTIFHDDHDRQTFLDLLAEASFEVHAYALMGNHYHLLVHTPEAGLSDSMMRIGREYSLHHHARHASDGPLCRSRFKSILVDAEAYLLTLSRYIHMNPVEAGLASHPADYAWSSCATYLGAAPKPWWLHTATTLEVAGGPSGYADLLEVDAPDYAQAKSFIEKPRPGAILGRGAFLRKVEARRRLALVAVDAEAV